ncbi:MAG TPA: acyl-ACP thioesterase domain-containing protein [Verrucomicrobiae bacterium]
MSQPPLIWSEPLIIHSYDVDFSRQATLEALCRHFLEAAWNHAEALGFGFSQLARDSKVWVLSRLLLQMRRYPRWGDRIGLNTWPRGTQSLFALREFELLDAAGQRIGGATSAWLILDVNSRRPQRVEKYLTPITPVSSTATDREPEKLPPCSGNCASSWPVRYTDVDLNGHANSARYIGWLMDSYPADWHQRYAPSLVELNYLGESHQGDTLSLRTGQSGPCEFLHSIVKSDQQEACRARVDWADK